MELLDYWKQQYDLRKHERSMNTFPHFKVIIENDPIHFLHVRGKGLNPVPLILSHGWPWTFWDFRKLIGPLTDPAAYGGNKEDAFDVIIPSPALAFSTPERNWHHRAQNC
jgi:hypothetical protein